MPSSSIFLYIIFFLILIFVITALICSIYYIYIIYYKKPEILSSEFQEDIIPITLKMYETKDEYFKKYLPENLNGFKQEDFSIYKVGSYETNNNLRKYLGIIEILGSNDLGSTIYLDNRNYQPNNTKTDYFGFIIYSLPDGLLIDNFPMYTFKKLELFNYEYMILFYTTNKNSNINILLNHKFVDDDENAKDKQIKFILK